MDFLLFLKVVEYDSIHFLIQYSKSLDH